VQQFELPAKKENSELAMIMLHIAVPSLQFRALFLKAFNGTGARITMGDLLTVAEDTVVSPANSHGYLDGGIDQVYRNHFGPELEKRLLDAIERLGGTLPVGKALTIHLSGEHKIKRIIFAPTMEMPEPIPGVQVFRATLAALKEVTRINCNAPEGDRIRELWFPAMGTGVGQVDPEEAASEMCLAWNRWRAGSE
jgi:O-acetyl-ADP-ribose deacetylase (regulator of RNase III)